MSRRSKPGREDTPPLPPPLPWGEPPEPLRWRPPPLPEPEPPEDPEPEDDGPPSEPPAMPW